MRTQKVLICMRAVNILILSKLFHYLWSHFHTKKNKARQMILSGIAKHQHFNFRLKAYSQLCFFLTKNVMTSNKILNSLFICSQLAYKWVLIAYALVMYHPPGGGVKILNYALPYFPLYNVYQYIVLRFRYLVLSSLCMSVQSSLYVFFLF